MYPSYSADDENDPINQQLAGIVNGGAAPMQSVAPDPLGSLAPANSPPVDVAATAPDAGPTIPQISDPSSLDAAPTITVGANGVPKNPFDSGYQDTMKKALASITSQIDGITADRNKLRDESNSLTNNLGNDATTGGAALGATIIAALGGAKLGYATGAGAKAATDYSNNLESQEKQRQAEISASLRNDESQLGDLTKFSQNMQLMPMKQQEELSTDWQKGLVPDVKPGETPFQSKEDAEVEVAKEKSRTAVGNQPLRPEDATMLEQKLNLKPGSLMGATVNDGQMALRAHGFEVQANNQSGKAAVQDAKTAAPGNFSNAFNPDGTKKPVPAPMQDKLASLDSGYNTVMRNASGLASIVNADGLTPGDKQVQIAQFVDNMMPAIRAMDNQGVKFNEFLQKIDVGQLGTSASYEDRMKAFFLGQDPQTAVQRFMQEMTAQVNAKANSYNSFLDPQKVKQFDPNAFATYDKFGAFNYGSGAPAAGAAAPGAAPAAAATGTTQKIDLTQAPPGLTPAQFQDWKRQHLQGAP